MPDRGTATAECRLKQSPAVSAKGCGTIQLGFFQQVESVVFVPLPNEVTQGAIGTGLDEKQGNRTKLRPYAPSAWKRR